MSSSLVGNIGRLTTSAPMSQSIFANLRNFNMAAPITRSIVGNIGRTDLKAPMSNSAFGSIGDARIAGGGVSNSLLASIGKLNVTAPISNSWLGSFGKLNVFAPVSNSLVGSFGSLTLGGPVSNSIIGNFGNLNLAGPVSNSIIGNLGGTITMKSSGATTSGTPKQTKNVVQQTANPYQKYSSGTAAVRTSSSDVDGAQGSSRGKQLPKYPRSYIVTSGNEDLSKYDLSGVTMITNFGHELIVNDTLRKNVLITNTGSLKIQGAKSLNDIWMSNLMGGRVEVG